MINKVTLVGRLGAEPEVRTLESGAMVAKFGMATTENYRDRAGEWQEQTEWHDVVVWRNLAERAQEYLKKGSLIYLEGKLSHRKWQDKDGNNRKTTEVVGSYFRMMPTGQRSGGNDMSAEDSPDEMAAPTAKTPTAANSGPAARPAAANQPMDDGEDLPF
jgi:single-strand DNA-binding protein